MNQFTEELDRYILQSTSLRKLFKYLHYNLLFLSDKEHKEYVCCVLKSSNAIYSYIITMNNIVHNREVF